MNFNRKSLLSLATILALSSFNTVFADENNTTTLDSIEVISNDSVTEDSNSYTIPAMSTSTKMNLAPIDTPQSVSVVTSQQMEDFDLTTLDDALNIATGVDVATVEEDRTFFTSRGFEIKNILTDGVGGSITSNIYINGDIDMALYDHIEVTRGATGLSSNHGDPSATINLVRKRPTKQTQSKVKAELGSWSNRRVEADVSGSLNDSETIRARVIGAYQKSKSYLDRYESDTNTFGAIIEGDIGENTVLTAGITRIEDNNDGTQQGGLDPVTANSKNYDVSTSTSPDWAFRDVVTTDVFLELNSVLSDTWKLKGTYAYKNVKQDSNWLTVWNSGSGTYLENFTKVDEDTKEHLFDITLNNNYTLNGMEHELVFGLNHTRQKYTEDIWRDGSSYGTLVDLDTWDGSTTDPDFSGNPSDSTYWTLKETSLFAATNYHILDNLNLLIGNKLTKYSKKGYSSSSEFTEKESGVSTPYASLLYKLNDNISTYISYTTTFNPQNSEYEDGTRFDPEEGKNYELGVKSSLFDDKLNLAFSVYKVKQNNIAVWAGTHSSTGKTYYTDENVIAKGFDIEIAGKLSDDINASLGYTHLTSVKNDEGEDTSLYMARDLLKTSITYAPSGIPGLKIGASANYKSKTNDGRDESSSLYLAQGGYTIYNLMASYNINKHAKLSFNLKNLTDKKYYNNLIKPYATYGAPRSYGVSLEYKF